MKALRRTFRDTYGFNPPKTRRVVEPIRLRWWKRALYWITRKPVPTATIVYPSTWRKWKKLAKSTDA